MIKTLWAKVDEKLFAGLWVLATIAAAFFMVPDNVMAITEIVVVKMIYVSMLLVVSVGAIYFLRGTQYDVYEEVFENGNVAAAIITAALVFSIAMVIGK